jgi:hypothetical protein
MILLNTDIYEYLKDTKVLKEYLTRDVVSLKNYFSLPLEIKKSYLPYEYYGYFDDFVIETDYDFVKPTETIKSDYDDEQYEVDMFDDDYELIDWLERNDKKTFDAFADYLYDKLSTSTLNIPDEEYPAWIYFDDNVQLVKNQWLVHLTDSADAIAREGFKYGVDDMTKLGLTCSLGEFDKKYGGYNFAYTLLDFKKYARRDYTQGGGYKYGKEAVVFNASGIKLWHDGDKEYQVIFYGNTARNIIPITSGEKEKYAVYSKSGKVLFENDSLDRVVDWITDNYIQYRKSIV